jgi:hypothetical protein
MLPPILVQSLFLLGLMLDIFGAIVLAHRLLHGYTRLFCDDFHLLFLGLVASEKL